MTEWVWWALAVIVAGILAYANRCAYRCGIWDGAFNQFLPVVQQEMRRYDPKRAAEILGDDEA